MLLKIPTGRRKLPGNYIRGKVRILSDSYSNMELKLNGVGSLKNCSVSIDGLTVILGENGSGKSTILKALYSLGDAVSDLGGKKISAVGDALYDTMFKVIPITEKGYPDLLKKLNAQDYASVISQLHKIILEKHIDDPSLDKYLETVEHIWRGESDQDFAESVVKRNLESEFTTVREVRCLSDDSPASLELIGSGEAVGVSIDTDDVCKWKGKVAEQFSSAIYYDTPFVLDEDYLDGDNHRSSLKEKILPRSRDIVSELVSRPDIKAFDSVLREVVDGEFRMENRSMNYVTGDGLHLSVSNLAAGAKVFVVLKLLAQNGFLNSRTLLLLDEPEVHLHPTWLNVLARLLVIVSQKVGAKVVMTTHSPQLLLAVQACSLKAGRKADFYLIRKEEKGLSEVKDLGDNLEEVYSVMARSFEEADNLYWEAVDADRHRFRTLGLSF